MGIVRASCTPPRPPWPPPPVKREGREGKGEERRREEGGDFKRSRHAQQHYSPSPSRPPPSVAVAVGLDGRTDAAALRVTRKLHISKT